jgi:hypothetical protein
MVITLFGRKNKQLINENIETNPANEIPVKKELPIVGKTLRVQDVMNFFTHDANPAYFDARLEAEIAKMQQGSRQVPWPWIFGIAILLLFGAIAYSIINGQLQANSAIQTLKELATGTTQQAKVITATTTTVPTKTIIPT